MAISVVIPMYNAEKFIGACLQSILLQTFQNYEVIIVDDCSTDNSVEVVKSYEPKFGGRLKLYHMKKNSGCPGAPTNKGIALASGKYIYAIDNDDLLVNKALELLYLAAETFNADVVYLDRVLAFEIGTEKPFPEPENIYMSGRQNGALVDEPTLETEDLATRMEKFLRYEFGYPAWRKLVQRDLLIENEITFPNTFSAQDIIWTIKLLCFSKRFLKIPAAVYIKRVRNDSVSRKERPISESVSFWVTILAEGLAHLDKFLSEQEFFQRNPRYRLQLLDSFESSHAFNVINQSLHLQSLEVYNILKKAFAKNWCSQ